MSKQKRLKRYKPKVEAREATHDATDEDYKKLAHAVVMSLTFRHMNMILKLPYFVKFAEDFPHGILVKRDEKHNYYKAKTRKIADYLYKMGYLPQDAKGIIKSQREIAFLETRIEKMLDEPEKVVYNDVLDEKEGQ